MRIAVFIFSDKPAHRVVRHLVFWLIYCTYFYIQSLAPRKFEEFYISDTYYFAFLNLCCFGPVFIFAVYFSIYFLFPKTLAQKKYALFLFSFLLLYAAGTIVNYFMAGLFLSNVHYSIPVTVNFQHKLEFGNYNTRWGMIIATVAIGIKLTKTRYLQQKENLEILKKKTRTEMQLQKARIHPGFLLRSLDKIYSYIQSGSHNAPVTILNLSELLSYSLYENEKQLVPLENELQQLKNFIAIEQGHAHTIEVNIETGAATNKKYIVPLVIIKLTEEIIALLHNTDDATRFVALRVSAANDQVMVYFVFHAREGGNAVIDWPFIIDNAKKRLGEYYSPADYSIELSANKHETIIMLQVQLGDEPTGINSVTNTKVKGGVYDVL